MNQTNEYPNPLAAIASGILNYFIAYRYVHVIVALFSVMPFVSDYLIDWLTPFLVANLNTETRLLVTCSIAVLPIYGLIALVFYYLYLQLEAKVHDKRWLSALGYFLQVLTTLILGFIINESNTYYFGKSQLVMGLAVSPVFSIHLTLLSLVFVAGFYAVLRLFIMGAEKSLQQLVKG